MECALVRLEGSSTVHSLKLMQSLNMPVAFVTLAGMSIFQEVNPEQPWNI